MHVSRYIFSFQLKFIFDDIWSAMGPFIVKKSCELIGAGVRA